MHLAHPASVTALTVTAIVLVGMGFFPHSALLHGPSSTGSISFPGGLVAGILLAAKGKLLFGLISFDSTVVRPAWPGWQDRVLLRVSALSALLHPIPFLASCGLHNRRAR